MKLFITQNQSPGDICMLTCAVRDLKLTYPDIRINVKTSAQYLWDNNPYLDPTVTEKNADKVIACQYPLIHKSNKLPYHFIHGFRLYLSQQLKLPILPQGSTVDIHLSDKELSGSSNTVKGLPEKYWIINAGIKSDFTCKGWEFAKYAEVVERLKGKVTFVQIGGSGHTHPTLPGVIDLRGKTPKRKLITAVYNSMGVLTGVSYPMHLSMMPTKDGSLRPCVCLLGGREPITWVQQPNMQALHCCGMLDCCKAGGCWKSRVTPLNDGSELDKSLCTHPVKTASGQLVPKCMDMISVDDVVRKIEVCSGLYV